MRIACCCKIFVNKFIYDNFSSVICVWKTSFFSNNFFREFNIYQKNAFLLNFTLKKSELGSWDIPTDFDKIKLNRFLDWAFATHNCDGKVASHHFLIKFMCLKFRICLSAFRILTECFWKKSTDTSWKTAKNF